jgi:glycosyltransferase involved in cell wall biosynthesis
VTILFLISSEGYYGVENMLVTLSKALSAHGCRCVIGVFQQSHGPHPEIAIQARRQDLEVEIIGCDGKWDRSTVAQIQVLARELRADILHPQGYKSDVYAYASSRGLHCGLVATSHNWPSRAPKMQAYAALDRFLLRRFDRVVVVAEQVRQRLLRSGVGEAKICSIANGVDIERFRAAKPVLRKELGVTGPLIGYVGRLSSEKGGNTLLQAAERVLQTAPGVSFVFVGDGPCRHSWELLASELGIREHVVFTGVRSDMAEIYASFDLMVLPSHVEAMPICLLEAMASGKPVVASAVGSVPKVLSPEETGLLVAPGNSEQLANSILRVLRDYEFARSLGSAAREVVVKRHSAQAMAKKYYDIYEQVVAERQAVHLGVAA